VAVGWRVQFDFEVYVPRDENMVIVGYGVYKNYRIDQIPTEFLSELATRYKLSHAANVGADYNDLQITIALHEELRRRQAGGLVTPREPTAKELAKKLVTKGYQQLSKEHHPDRKGGDGGAQKRLNAVREQLQEFCNGMEDEYPEEALVIQESPGIISDDDIPF